MIECEKGTQLCLEYEPGMFRKVTVQYVTQYGAKDTRIQIEGMTSSFNAEGEERQYHRWFRRQLHPFDQAKIDATKVEKHRRLIAKMLTETDWDHASLQLLEGIKALLPAAEWVKYRKEGD